MFRRTSQPILGTHRVGYRNPHQLPIPCAQRWDLKLEKAKLWQEYIDPTKRGAWQLEDERHMSPEFSTFTGREMREMAPRRVGYHRSESILQRRLPNQTFLELASRRDVPYQENILFGKQRFDEVMHGMSMPTLYKQHKDMQRATRNMGKLHQNKFKATQTSGVKFPPANWQPIPDRTGEDEEE